MLNRTMTLGELIAALERKEPGAAVRFDFVYFKPDGSVHSYRGDYSQLAIGYTNQYEGPETEIKVEEFLKKLRTAVGSELIGYKGGNFLMSSDTLVWVANHSESGGTGIVDVDGTDPVILRTWKFDW